jgi:RNAse (barnase) inhibitor barstar
MRIINLDGRDWKTAGDFYTALLASIGAPENHAHNVNALIDTMVWGGDTVVKPPYEIRVSETAKLRGRERGEIELLTRLLAEARLEFRSRRGRDIEVSLNILS